MNFELQNIARVTRLSLEGRMVSRGGRTDPKDIEDVFSDEEECIKEKGGYRVDGLKNPRNEVMEWVNRYFF